MAKNSANLEVEVKFFVPDLAAVRARLLALGALVVRARVFERNVRFDTEDGVLQERWQLLRYQWVISGSTPIPDRGVGS